MTVADWNMYTESSPLTVCTFNIEFATVQLNKFLCQRQSNTCAFMRSSSLLIVHTMKFLKDAIDFVRWNADSAVNDFEYHVSFVLGESTDDGDLTGQCEFECIPNQIEDDFFPHVPIDPDGSFFAGGVDDVLDTPFLDCAAEQTGEVGGILLNIRFFECGAHLARFNAGEVQ